MTRGRPLTGAETMIVGLAKKALEPPLKDIPITFTEEGYFLVARAVTPNMRVPLAVQAPLEPPGPGREALERTMRSVIEWCSL